jgi:hypothetical protein
MPLPITAIGLFRHYRLLSAIFIFIIAAITIIRR